MIMNGSMAACRQMWCWSWECYILRATGSGLTHWGKLEKRDLKAWAHSDILHLTRPRLLIMPFPLEAIFFQTTTVTVLKGSSFIYYPWSFYCSSSQDVVLNTEGREEWSTRLCIWRYLRLMPLRRGFYQESEKWWIITIFTSNSVS